MKYTEILAEELRKRSGYVRLPCGHYFSQAKLLPDVNLDSAVCKKQIEVKRVCGHTHIRLCHQTEFEAQNPCKTVIAKKLDCGHYLRFFCPEEDRTEMKCPLKMKKTLKCGHKLVTCKDLHRITCNVPLQRRHPICRHVLDTTCSNVEAKCELICRKILQCGHLCRAFCHTGKPCPLEECERPCTRVCPEGHPCQKKCGEMCRCEAPCGKVCPEGHPCQKMCGEMCRCEAPCGKVCPEGHPCQKMCGEMCRCEAPCGKVCPEGHPCQKMCGEMCRCEAPCGKVCPEGHPCQKMCGETCRCEVLVEKEVDYCPQHKRLLPCHEEPGTYTSCDGKVTAYYNLECIHYVQGVYIKVPCGKMHTPAKALHKFCESPCEEYFDPDHGGCGHICTGTCTSCTQGRFHIRCQSKCGKELLCGHICQSQCCAICPPCPAKCQNKCSHKKCDKLCGEDCGECLEMCDYSCPHSKCTKLCGEVCNRKPCEERCPRELPCGHECMGFCGELCPPYCLLCNPEELQKGIFTGEELTRTLRFIKLENCPHVVESKSLEGHLNAKVSDEEISLVRCPLCRNGIVNLKRYADLLKINQEDKKKVYLKIFGSDEENEATIKNCKESVDNFEGEIILTEFLDFMQRNFLKSRVKLNKPQIKTYEGFFKLWAACEESIRAIYNLIDLPIRRRLIRKTGEFLKFLESREVPLIGNERIDINLELTRLNDFFALVGRMREDVPEVRRNMVRSDQSRTAFRNARKALYAPFRYTEDTLTQFLKHLRIVDEVTGSEITPEVSERRMIAAAFAPRIYVSTRGRWHKCRNGHTYHVTECGRVMELGTCPECNEQIGGEQHQLLPDNYVDDLMEQEADAVIAEAENPRSRILHRNADDYVPAERDHPILQLDLTF